MCAIPTRSYQAIVTSKMFPGPLVWSGYMDFFVRMYDRYLWPAKEQPDQGFTQYRVAKVFNICSLLLHNLGSCTLHHSIFSWNTYLLDDAQTYISKLPVTDEEMLTKPDPPVSYLFAWYRAKGNRPHTDSWLHQIRADTKANASDKAHSTTLLPALSGVAASAHQLLGHLLRATCA